MRGGAGAAGSGGRGGGAREHNGRLCAHAAAGALSRHRPVPAAHRVLGRAAAAPGQRGGRSRAGHARRLERPARRAPRGSSVAAPPGTPAPLSGGGRGLCPSARVPGLGHPGSVWQLDSEASRPRHRAQPRSGGLARALGSAPRTGGREWGAGLTCPAGRRPCRLGREGRWAASWPCRGAGVGTELSALALASQPQRQLRKVKRPGPPQGSSHVPGSQEGACLRKGGAGIG